MNTRDRKDDGLLPALAGLTLLPLLLGAVWLFTAFNGKYRSCVRLENGMRLGYEAVFDLSRPFLKPVAVPKFPDGTPLVRDEMWALHVSGTTIYGVSLADEKGSSYTFAWRSDTGLIYEKEEPGLYRTLVSEAGRVNWDLGAGSYGTGALLEKLSSRPQFEIQRCPTALVTW